MPSSGQRRQSSAKTRLAEGKVSSQLPLQMMGESEVRLREVEATPNKPAKTPDEIYQEAPFLSEEPATADAEGGKGQSSHPEVPPREDPRRPHLTERARRTLDNRLRKLEKRVSKQARAGARRNGLVHADKPHILSAWRESLRTANVIERRMSWGSGVLSGCLFSLIVALFSKETPPQMEVSIGLLVMFAVSLAVGWSATK